ncbi:MAG TPA: DEAD/DEAH box helicase [Nitrosarchaeum sp.]|nr:DEAD/DEAH box helicase [Nitrosarchaeum sp.]
MSPDSYNAYFAVLSDLLRTITDSELKNDILQSQLDIRKNYDPAQLTYLAARLCKIRYLTRNTKYEAYPLDMKTDFNLSPYQISALETMKRIEEDNERGLRGGILAFKMGLGKTITSICHALMCKHQNVCDELNEEKFADNSTLIVTTKVILQEWKNQLDTFFGYKISYIILHSDYTAKEIINEMSLQEIVQYQIVITTYDVISRVFANNKGYLQSRSCVCYDNGKLVSVKNVQLEELNVNSEKKGCINLFDFPWKRVIFDESTKFTGEKTLVFKSVMALYGAYKWCLTGTPIKNTDKDVYNQLRVCYYTPLEKKCDVELRNAKAKKVMSAHILPLDYCDTNIILPPKNVIHMEFQMTPAQRQCYEIINNASKKALSDYTRGTVEMTTIFSFLCRMRQCCVAPILIMGKEDNITKLSPELEIMREWLNDINGESGLQSPKIKGVINLTKSIPKADKIIIFSSWSKCLKLISEGLDPDEFCFIDGSTKGKERLSRISDFKETKRILLLTLKLGSEGLNLTEANHVIIVEPWWTPSVTEQATFRVWRQGQTKDVHEYHIFVKNSIEQKIASIAQEKGGALNHFMGKKEIDINFVKRILCDK